MLLQSGERRYRLIRVEADLEDLVRAHTSRSSLCQWLTTSSRVLPECEPTPAHLPLKSEDLRHQEDIVICSQSCLFDLHTIVNTIVNINVIVKSSV